MSGEPARYGENERRAVPVDVAEAGLRARRARLDRETD
jgi:hypothetical protein